jgi:hypothetical protein
VEWVPEIALILHLCKSFGQGEADSKPTTAESHVVREEEILDMSLRGASHIEHASVIILGQDLDQILREEESIIISDHKPIHFR